MARQKAREMLDAITVARLAQSNPKDSSVKDIMKSLEQQAEGRRDDAAEDVPMTVDDVKAMMAVMGFAEA